MYPLPSVHAKVAEAEVEAKDMEEEQQYVEEAGKTDAEENAETLEGAKAGEEDNKEGEGEEEEEGEEKEEGDGLEEVSNINPFVYCCRVCLMHPCPIIYICSVLIAPSYQRCSCAYVRAGGGTGEWHNRRGW